MSNPILKLPKSVYSLDVIRSAILSFNSGACLLSDETDQWSIDLSIMKEPIQASDLLRRIDEFSLRASLEQRFAAERDAIVALAFGRE